MVHLLACLLCVIIAFLKESTADLATDGYGCYRNNKSNRILTGAEFLNYDKNTKESCVKKCLLDGYKYSGVENGSHCYCGKEIAFPKNKISNELCNDMHCIGNLADYCGGLNKIWVYLSEGYGCYNDKDTDRILKGFEKLNDKNTKENCASTCIDAGYKYAGVKNGKQCFCGNEILLRKNKIPDELCEDIKCAGNSEDYCGGQNKIWVYLSNGFGCYSDKDSDHVLTDAMYLNNNVNTKESCAYSCTLSGHKYAGIKYGKHCFCGNEIRLRKNKIPDELCNEKKCSGNSEDFCGGEHKVWVYLSDDRGCYSDADSDRILTDAVYIGSNNNTKEKCATFCTHGGYKYAGVEHGKDCYCGDKIRLRKNKIPDELCKDTKCSGNSEDYCGGQNKIWVYLSDGYGCYESSHSHPIMTKNITTANNTREYCGNSCRDGGYKYAGVEYGSLCFCDNEIRYRRTKVPDKTCDSMKCTGNSNDYCGGLFRIWIYSSYGYGCYSNSYSEQVLADRKLLTDKKNNIKNCRNICKTGKYTYAGVANGNQCFCGNEIRLRKNKIPDELCNEKMMNYAMKCSGNPEEFCGGQNKIWIYSPND